MENVRASGGSPNGPFADSEQSRDVELCVKAATKSWSPQERTIRAAATCAISRRSPLACAPLGRRAV